MKKYQTLILDSINQDITGTKIEKLMQVKGIFEADMIYQGRLPSVEIIKDWLQGLCSAVSIPFMNHDIIEWEATQYKRRPKPMSQKGNCEEWVWVDNYWNNVSKTLFNMLYGNI